MSITFLFVIACVFGVAQACSPDAAFNETARAKILPSPSTNFSSIICTDVTSIYYNFTMTNTSQWNMLVTYDQTAFPNSEITIILFDSQDNEIIRSERWQGREYIAAWLSPGPYILYVRGDPGSTFSVNFTASMYISTPCSPDIAHTAQSRGRLLPSSSFNISSSVCMPAQQIYYNFTITEPGLLWGASFTTSPVSESFDLDLFDALENRPESETFAQDLYAYLVPGNYSIRVESSVPDERVIRFNLSASAAPSNCTRDAAYNRQEIGKPLPLSRVHQFTTALCAGAIGLPPVSTLFFNFTVATNSSLNATITAQRPGFQVIAYFVGPYGEVFPGEPLPFNDTRVFEANVTAGDYFLQLFSASSVGASNITVSMVLPGNPVATTVAPTSTATGTDAQLGAASTVSSTLVLLVAALLAAVVF